jgi:hypothetical protein
MDSFECDKCGKVCKDKKGLSRHFSKCRGLAEPVCIYCDIKFTRFSTLDDHLQICSKYQLTKQADEYNHQLTKQADEYKYQLTKQADEYNHQLTKQADEYNHQLTKQADEYKYQILLLNQQHEKEINDLKQQYEKEVFTNLKDYTMKAFKLEESLGQEKKMTEHYRNYALERECKVKQLEEEKRTTADTHKEEILELKKNLKEAVHLREEERQDVRYMIRKNPSLGGGQLSAKHSNNTNTNTTNSNNTNVTNNYHILNFDPSKLHNKMTDNSFIGNDQQFADLIVKHISDHFRVTDSSRSNLVWRDETGKEIKDSGGKQLVNRVIDEIKPDFVKQMERVVHRLQTPNQMFEETEYYNNVSKFTADVIEKKASRVTGIGKKIGKIGKHINDSSLSTNMYGDNTYFLIISAIEKLFQLNIFEWFDKDIVTLVRCFGMYLKEHIKGRSDPKQSPSYVYLNNDNCRKMRLHSRDCYILLQLSLSSLLCSNDNKAFVKDLLYKPISLTSSSEEDKIARISRLDSIYEYISHEETSPDNFETLFQTHVVNATRV